MIQVAPEYATAIETALGGGLQNIIAAGAADVREAIAFLKEGKGAMPPSFPSIC